MGGAHSSEVPMCSAVRWSCKAANAARSDQCPWAVGSGIEGRELLSQPFCNYEPWERSYGIHIFEEFFFFFEQKNLQ